MWKWAKDYFTFTRRERQGIIFLLFLILLVLLLPGLYSAFFTAESDELQDIARSFDKERHIATPVKEEFSTDLYHFDPNMASEEELANLGLPANVVKSIVNYRNKGGKFYQRDDLLKIYSISKEEYLRLRPYIRINREYAFPAERTGVPYASLVVDINNADSADLTRLRGIGAVLSSRIIKYRNRSGGFQDKNELLKVYGIDEDLLKSLEKNIIVGPKPVFPADNSREVYERKERPVIIVELNSADSATLTSVRGIGPVFARRIIKYRDLLGGFDNKDQLFEVYGLNQEHYDQITPQLIIDQQNIRRLNLNTSSYYDLTSHPYISKALAEHILALRSRQKQLNSITELRNSFLVDDDLYRKLAPYLEL